MAAASSTSAARAAEFLQDCGFPDARAYGSYEELVRDPAVDIVYVATPHSHHFQNVILCIEHGKHVLCEKAFTANAEQARALAAKARQKQLFLMEGVWTRYFPLSAYVRDVATSGRIGAVERVFADNSVDFRSDELDDGHRLVDPALAGGALLDLGVYSILWIFQVLYHVQPAAARQPPRVASVVRTARSGVDDTTTMVLCFPRPAAAGGDAHAVATTSMRLDGSPQGHAPMPAVRVQGRKGELHVFPPAWRPTRTVLLLNDGTVEEKHWPQPGPGSGSCFYNGFGESRNPEGEGHGMFWEADEAALALTEGRLEGRCQGLDESALIMDVLDEVRRQGGVSYPHKVETTDYVGALG